MTAQHFFVDSIESDQITIEGDDARHAVRVLRITNGEAITVSDGRGGVASAVVVEGGRTLIARVLDRRIEQRVPPTLAVYQGLPKSGKLEEVVQSLVQIGVDVIVPVRMRRSVPKWDPQRASGKVARLRAVAREAAMQSRRAHLPHVGDVVDLVDLPRGSLVLHEMADRRLRDAVPVEPPERIDLVVGPEGGIHDEELSRLLESGGLAVTLGPTVLRTELAAVVAATALLSRWGRLA